MGTRASLLFIVMTTIFATNLHSSKPSDEKQKEEKVEYETTVKTTFFMCKHGWNSIKFGYNIGLKKYVNYNWTKSTNSYFKENVNELIGFVFSAILFIIESVINLAIGCLVLLIMVYGLIVIILGLFVAIVIIFWNIFF